MEVFDFIFKNQLSEIERAHEVVNHFGERFHLNSEVVFELDLALEEILTNIIRYAYNESGNHQIEVQFRFSADQLSIEVMDDGRPFNPLDAPPPDIDKPLEERRIGGLGIFLVRKMTDQLQYRRDNGKNVLTMIKRFSR